jgi:hypothetical protein
VDRTDTRRCALPRSVQHAENKKQYPLTAGRPWLRVPILDGQRCARRPGRFLLWRARATQLIISPGDQVLPAASSRMEETLGLAPLAQSRARQAGLRACRGQARPRRIDSL